MTCSANTDCYNLNCVTNNRNVSTCVNQPAPADPPVCTFNVSAPANKCPNVFCIDDSECQSGFCYYWSDTDANGLCDTFDDDPSVGECYPNTTYSMNRCDGVACDRDNQCASLVCGDTGLDALCQAWSGEYVQPTYPDDGNQNQGSGSGSTVIIIVCIVAAIAIVGGLLYWRRNKKLQEQLDGQNRALISNN